ESMELTDQNVSGMIPQTGVNTTAAPSASGGPHSYQVLSSNGFTVLTTVTYSDGTPADNVYLVDGATADQAHFETALSAIANGSDTRAFVEDRQDAKSFGKVGGQRSDTIMLVRVDPKAHHAWMLSFPRDLWLPIAPDGHLQRINTAYDTGAQNLIETIKADFN